MEWSDFRELRRLKHIRAYISTRLACVIAAAENLRQAGNAIHSNVKTAMFTAIYMGTGSGPGLVECVQADRYDNTSPWSVCTRNDKQPFMLP